MAGFIHALVEAYRFKRRQREVIKIRAEQDAEMAKLNGYTSVEEWRRDKEEYKAAEERAEAAEERLVQEQEEIRRNAAEGGSEVEQ